MREQELHVADVGRLDVEDVMAERAAPELLGEMGKLRQREPRAAPFRRKVRGPEPRLVRLRALFLQRREQRREPVVPELLLERVDLLLHELAHRLPKASHPIRFREVHRWPPAPAWANSVAGFVEKLRFSTPCEHPE